MTDMIASNHTAAPSPTRDRILDAAENLIHEGGVAAFTLDAVAQSAAVSKGGLLYHFSSKDDLISALLVRMANRFGKTFREELEQDSSSALLAFVRVLRRDYEFREQRFMPLLLAREQQDPCLELHSLMTSLMRKSATSASRDGTLLLLAGLGLVLSSVAKLPRLDPVQARDVFDRMEALAKVTLR